MATDKPAFYLGNINKEITEQFWIPGLVQAGADQAIYMGEIVVKGTTYWTPLGADQEMNGTVGICGEKIASGDLAGYRKIYIPRPGDVYAFKLASASAITIGSAVYYSSSQQVTTTGTYALGRQIKWEHYPHLQRHQSVGDVGDEGTTIKNAQYAHFMFLESVSYLYTLTRGLANAPSPTDQYSATRGATPILIQTTCTAAGGEDEVVMASTATKMKIVRAWMIARDTNAANVTLKDGDANAITDTVAKGTEDDAVVEFGNLVLEYATLAAASSIVATFSAAGSVDVCLLCVPIA